MSDAGERSPSDQRVRIVGLFSLVGGESWLAITLTPAVLIFDVLAMIPVLLLGGSMLFG